MERGRILLADDERPFLDTTADLLRRERFVCDTATSAAEAIARVAVSRYDLLISDLEMPGNRDLALVRDIAARDGGLPVIIVTGYPSTGSAIASIELPVAAYLVKPVDFQDLVTHVDRAIGRYRSWRAMRGAEEELARWRAVLATSGDGAATGNGIGGLEAFLALTMRNVMGGVEDLAQLGRALARASDVPHACQAFNCPRGAQLHEAVRQTIAVLEETKSSFKSRRLAELRQQLELLLQTG